MASSKAKPQQVYLLIWGGGDEPESPEITVHGTKAGALAQAESGMGNYEDDLTPDEFADKLRELRDMGRTDDLPNECWFEIQRTKVLS